MIYHVVPQSEWNVNPDEPYAPASLAQEGFVHCSADEATTLAIVNAFYRDSPRPLLALVLDENRLAAKCEWEAPVPAPPPGVAEGTLFPHVFGPINRDAVNHVLQVHWNNQDQATALSEVAND